MKPCRFCLENIHESAEACGHCGNWQPSPDEIASAYNAVLVRMASSRIGFLRIVPYLLSTLLFVTVIFKFLEDKSEISFEKITGGQTILFFLAFVLFLVKRNLFQQCLDKIAFVNAVELDRLLHQELKWQIRKPQPYNRMLMFMVCIIVLLLIFINAKIFGIL